MKDFLYDISAYLQSLYFEVVRLTPRIILAVLAILVAFIVAKVLNRWALKRLRDKTEQLLLAQFLGQALQFVIIVTGLIIALSIVGMGGAASKIMAAAGVSAFIIGFAFKDVGENFLAGIIMAFNRPFSFGDTVETNGVKGKIIGLSIRQTVIKTFDGKDIFIPNGAILKTPLTNFTVDGNLRHEFNIGLDYGADFDKAMALIKRTLGEIPGILKDPEPNVFLTEFGDNAVNISIQFWMDTYDKTFSAIKVKSEAILLILKNLNENGHYIPSPIIELKNYQDTPLIPIK